jgi:DNA polymerase I-like protein with 3'-5' exonuclease and polymerase domains/uracil-DNA glycosylase
VVLGTGSDNPEIIIITDYPSDEEISNNQAFVGSTGNLFKSLFEENHYSYNNVYRTTFCKEPASEFQTLIRKGKYKLNGLPIEVRNYLNSQHDLLKEELQEFKPLILIAAGDIPLYYLGNETKCRKFRGSIIPSNFSYNNQTTVPLLSVLPPRWIFSDFKYKYITVADISKAIFAINNKTELFPQNYHLWTCFNDTALREGLKRVGEWCTVDIETIYNYITCLGIAVSSHEAFCIPFQDPRIPTSELIAMLRTLDSFLRNKKLLKVGQNFNYDWSILEKKGFSVSGFIGDTMLLSHVLYPDFPKGLDFLTSIYTNIPYYKDDGKEAFRVPAKKDKQFDKLYLYNCTDCVATYQTYESQLKELDEAGLKNFYEKIEFPLIFLYHEIEKTGILTDDAQIYLLTVKYTMLLALYTDRIISAYGAPINFNSSQQVAEFVYHVLDCPPRYNRTMDEETGEVRRTLATDEETLETLALFYTDSKLVKECLYCIIAIRKLQRIIKFLETPIHPDGRMRTSITKQISTTGLTGTKSGRTSFTKSIDFTILQDKKGKYKKQGLGGSFQTLPKHGDLLYDGTVIGDDLRTIFVPKRDHIFVEGDKSGAEARVVAVLSDNLTFLKEFDRPPGIHCVTAGWIYDVDPFTIKKDTPEYNYGKRGRHMANYDGGIDRLATMLHCPRKTAEFVLDRIHAADPSIRGVFHERVRLLLEERAVFETPQGRKRQNFKRVDKDTIKEYYSYIPQATVTDDLKEGMLRMWRGESSSWFNFLNESHDSCLAELHKKDKNKYADLFLKEMQQPISFRTGSFVRNVDLVIPVELNWSDTNWKYMEKF